jgi:hypothetical protein
MLATILRHDLLLSAFEDILLTLTALPNATLGCFKGLNIQYNLPIPPFKHPC